jgi:oligoendopeptidase F
MAFTTPTRNFVPAKLDAADLAQLQPIYQELMDRPIHSAGELSKWLENFSELASVMDEYAGWLYINKSCHTDNAEYEKAYLHFIENIDPKLKPIYFALQKKYLQSPYRGQLQDNGAGILGRRWQADVDIFREENIPLETQVTQLNSEYDKINGAMTIQFRGTEYTMQQAARFLEEPDRQVRQEVWELSNRRRLAERDRIDGIFDQLFAKRATIARNTGMSDYRAVMWKANKRFDYTPEDCLRFADAIAATCVPVVDELNRQRQADLGLEKLRPWDIAVDPKNRPALRPFQEDQIPLFVEKVKNIFQRMSPALAEDFDLLRQQNKLDLASRKGKQPGGYQMPLEESRVPFIFMNAAGLQRDVDTLLHEGGHAFHSLASKEIGLMFVRSAPMEFCEVASMSMELLGSEHFDLFYSDPANAARARRILIEGIIRFLPWMATIDSFQHWIYTHPEASREERTKFWLSLMDRFGGKVDYSGWESVRETLWQRQAHIFHAPFYYIEYGIAQLGALQIWMKSKQNPQKALANYRAALALGGTRPLPELFAAAGIIFDFSEKTLKPLMAAMQDELASLPR